MAPLVVVGASLAGLRAAQAARAAGYDGELVLVGAERHRPYTRPPLSKELLAGKHEPERCAFDCSALEARWRLGETAIALDSERCRLRLDSGDELPYDRIVLTTGCRAREWRGPGTELTGLFTLRDLDDALALRAALLRGDRRRATKLAVVGAGFVGCEVAASARRLGAEVTLVDVAPRPLLPFGAEIGERCAALHERHGVTLRLGVGLRGFLGERSLVAVELEDGSIVPADVAVVALGAVPNVDWLQGPGLRFERGGVLCDGTLTAAGQTDVLCAGDIASWPHPLAGGEVVRVEHWTNAAEQGALAGRNALVAPAERTPYEAVPYFWSDQYDVKLQAAGFPALAERQEVVEDEDGRFVAIGFRGERMVAAVAWNAPRQLMLYRRALAADPVAG